ncbi:general transcription and DNA repair factor IIH subunit ssl1 [Naviculisporaceae sp. PSN 640]
MADSDGEYVEDLSDDDLHQGSAVDSTYGTRSKDRKRTRDGKPKRNAATWETFKQTWGEILGADTADGTLPLAERIEAEKRRRLRRDTDAVQRGIIRHLMLVLDMSSAMADKDMIGPNAYRLTLNYAIEFVQVYFAQNPISQLGILGLRDGLAITISRMGGNAEEHIEKLKKYRDDYDPQGNPSLQNALEMCRGSLYDTPSHGTREVLIIYGALFTIDPRDINDTINDLVADRIRVTVIGLSAEVHICAELCRRTNGGMSGNYHVALHEQHFHELFLAATTPPVTRTKEQDNPSLLMMGFPSRKLAEKGTLVMCGCHAQPCREIYACTRCNTSVCRLPIECPSCRLTLVQSTHLARSYHHIFPLKNWVDVSWAEAAAAGSVACYSCMAPFPPVPKDKAKIGGGGGGRKEGSEATATDGKRPTAAGTKTSAQPKGITVSESSRYACQVCRNHFCIDCDLYAHEVVHNCPGCQSNAVVVREQDGVNGGGGQHHTNGNGSNGDAQAMEID